LEEGWASLMTERHPFTGWSLRRRSGHDTPSFEEFFWYHVTPGGFYRTATSGDPEDFDYYVSSTWIWLGTGAIAADAAATASAVGTTNLAAEFTLWRYMSMIRAIPVATVPAIAFTAHYHTMTSPPSTEAHRSEPGETSWWRAVAQAMTGGVGVGSGIQF
jgi:hypothetical protein